MKTSIKLILLPLITFLLQACPPPAPGLNDDFLEIQTSLLTEDQWNLFEVTLDGGDVASQWDGFSVKFNTDGSYFTQDSNSGLVWPVSGSWAFKGIEGADLDVINRSDGISMDISDFTSSRMTLTFTIDPPASIINGRASMVQAIDGEYIFKFIK